MIRCGLFPNAHQHGMILSSVCDLEMDILWTMVPGDGFPFIDRPCRGKLILSVGFTKNSTIKVPTLSRFKTATLSMPNEHSHFCTGFPDVVVAIGNWQESFHFPSTSIPKYKNHSKPPSIHPLDHWSVRHVSSVGSALGLVPQGCEFESIRKRVVNSLVHCLTPLAFQ